MISVFTYTNYREFLRAWISEKQSSPRPMSLRQFARKAKIASPNYFQRVVSSDRKLTDEMVEKFVSGLSLAPKEADYFRALVRFNQAEDSETKLLYLRNLERLSQRSEIKTRQDRNLFREWYYPVVWELASCKDFELTAENVVSALKIGKREAKDAIEFLTRSGYLVPKAGARNRFEQPSVRIHSTDEVVDLSLQALHRKFSALGSEKLSLPVEEREFQGITVALSPERMKLAKSMIKKAAKEILESLANDSEADRVYRVQLQLFPLSEPLNKLNPKTVELEN